MKDKVICVNDNKFKSIFVTVNFVRKLKKEENAKNALLASILRKGTQNLKSEKEIDEFAKSTIEMFAGEIEEIEAVCANTLLNPVVDKFGKNITIIKNDDNTFKLILDTDRNGFLYCALKNLREVEIIKPISLRNEIKEIIKKANDKYEI